MGDSHSHTLAAGLRERFAHALVGARADWWFSGLVVLWRRSSGRAHWCWGGWRRMCRCHCGGVGMSTFRLVVSEYREEMRRSKQQAAHRVFWWARSRGETLAWVIVGLVVPLAVVIPESVFQYSLAVHALVTIATVLTWSVAWVAWVVWGRAAFPLENDG